jgi:hypothetical protein
LDQPSNTGEFPYQQPYYDYAPYASSSWEPGYDHTYDDPPAWGNYWRWDWSPLRPKSLSSGGGIPMIHSSIYHILSVLCISMCHIIFLMVLVLISTFQNTKRPKIFCCFSLFVSLVL